MQVKSITECSKGEHSAIILTFIKLPFVIKIFVLSIFEWPFYTDFTVFVYFKLFEIPNFEGLPTSSWFCLFLLMVYITVNNSSVM